MCAFGRGRKSVVMLGKVGQLVRYKVVVLSLKPQRRRGFADDLVVINDLDTFFGFSYKNHRSGKYFDLWFSNPKEKDIENFVTFGRIIRIEPPYEGTGATYVTKFGRFYVQEMSDEISVMQGQGSKVRQRSEVSDYAVISRADGGRRYCGFVGTDRGGPDPLRKSKGVTSDLN